MKHLILPIKEHNQVENEQIVEVHANFRIMKINNFKLNSSPHALPFIHKHNLTQKF